MAENADQQDALFVNLVLIFQNAAMQQMGKITNPMTGKTERNLDQARFSIDVIDMLRSKTRGNLSSELEKLLDSTLTNLRMNYVEEASKPAAEQPGAERSTAGDKTGTPGSARTEGGAGKGGGSERTARQGPGAGGESETPAGGASGKEGEGEIKDASGD